MGDLTVAAEARRSLMPPMAQAGDTAHHGIDWSLPLSDEVVVVAVLLGLVLVVPLIAGRFKVPSIVGLILAGTALGPFGVGLLDSEGSIEMWGVIGLQYIMFLAGLEIDIDEFLKSKWRSMIFGALSFGLPASLGFVAGITVLGYQPTTAVLLGAMFGAHTLLAYPLISKLGLGRQESVTITIGATIIADLAALLTLAVITGDENGHVTVSYLLLLAIKFALFLGVVFILLPPFGRWFFRNVGGDGVPQYLFILVMVFACGVLAAVAGLEPIIGAFLAGLAVNRLVPENSPLMSRIMFVGEALFIPVFLIWVGMLVNLGALMQSAAAWGVAGIMAIPVIVSKALAAKIAQWLFGYGSDEGWVMFGLSTARAAATLAVVLVGKNLGLFDDSILNATVLLILVTCMISPWMVEHFGRKAAHRLHQAEPKLQAERQRLLVPLSNPDTAAEMVELAVLLRGKGAEDPVYPIAVVPDGDGVRGQVQVAERMLSAAVLHGAAADVAVTPLVRVDFNVANGIVRAAKEERISTVVLGWSGQANAGQLILGGTLDQVLERCLSRILVARIVHSMSVTKRVLLALPPFIEQEPGFSETIMEVKNLTRQLGADLEVLAAASGGADYGEFITKIKPDIANTSVHGFPSWTRVRNHLIKQVGPRDLVVLVSAREGTAAWQPGLDRLPRLMASGMEDINFLVLYPPLPGIDLQPIKAENPGLDSAFQRIEGIILDQAHSSLDVAIEELVGLMPDVGEQGHYLRETLNRDAREYATQLSPGVVLLHSHTPLVASVSLLLGTSASGIDFPLLRDEVHVVFVLLSPAAQPPQQHLKRLATIAKIVRRSDALERLRAAESAADLQAYLTEATKG